MYYAYMEILLNTIRVYKKFDIVYLTFVSHFIIYKNFKKKNIKVSFDNELDITITTNHSIFK